jgi:hypothetical protein
VDAQVLGPPNIEKKVGLTGGPLLQEPFDVVYYTSVPYH